MKKLVLLSAMLLSIGLRAQWTYTSLSAPKAYMGATVLGSKAYFAGGYNNSGMLSTVEIYDFKTGEWDHTNNLSVARELPFAVGCGSKVLFAGGADFYGSGAVYATVDIFDTLDLSWSVEQLSVPRLQAAVVSYGNKVLFAGGANLLQQSSFDIVDIYDVQTEEWTTNSLSEARTTWWAVVGDLAIFAGGYDFPTASKRVDIYNFTTQTWSIDSLSVARAFVGMTTIGNKVMIAGGMTNDNIPSNIVDIYDASTGTWETDAISVPRAFTDNQNVVAMGGKVYFVGGGIINLNGAFWTTVYNVIDIYDPASDTWSVDYLADSYLHRAVVPYGNQFLVAGGTWNSVYSPEVEIYSCSCLPEGITFTTQEEIDNFQTNHPGCTYIEGDVTIEGAEILNLNGLNVLNSIGGNLTISNDSSLTQLTGLNNLNTIGGSLSIYGNVLLSDMADLAELDAVGGEIRLGIEIWDWWTGQYSYVGNHSLTSISGLQGITSVTNLGVIGNDLLTNLTGLNNIISISGSLAVCGNDSLTNLQGLDALIEIGSHLIIQENNHLNDFEGLNNLTSVAGKAQIGRDTRIGYEEWPPPGGNDLLESFSGIDNLSSVGGDFIIGDNNSLTSLSGLLGLNSIGGSLIITGDTNLTNLNGLENISFINGELAIRWTALTNLDGLNNISAGSIDELYIRGNPSLSSCDVQSICDYLVIPNGTISIGGNAPGCNSQTEVEAACLVTVEETTTGNGFTIIPNPAKDNITISYPVITDITALSIFNMSGEKVIERQLDDNETQIDISVLPSGVYFVRLQNEKMVEVGKMVKE